MFDKEGNGFISTPGEKYSEGSLNDQDIIADLMEIMQSVGDVLSLEETEVSIRREEGFPFSDPGDDC